MFNRALKAQLTDLSQRARADELLLTSLKHHLLYAEYSPEGKLLEISGPLATRLGGQPNQLIGRYHRQLCTPEQIARLDSRSLWHSLTQGKAQQLCLAHQSGESTVWLDAQFVPIREGSKVIKVVQLCTDVTQAHEQNVQRAGVIDALERSMAVIEFTPKGVILKANDNFLKVVNYRAADIEGKNHEIFCTPEFYRQQPDFWRELAAGSFKSGRFERRSSTGEVIWLEATYNPIYNEAGKVEKVVKFASDITARVQHGERVAEAARVAQQSAQQTSATAVEGSQMLNTALENFEAIDKQVNETVQLIQQLNEQSSQIKAIVSTISAIADQTNLLALNAAIEAARAGDLGRGFAVVADEVRQLAARTTQSTSQIEQVVKHNQALTQAITGQVESVSQSVDSGSLLNGQVAEVIEKINAGAVKVSHTVAELSLENQ